MLSGYCFIKCQLHLPVNQSFDKKKSDQQLKQSKCFLWFLKDCPSIADFECVYKWNCFQSINSKVPSINPVGWIVNSFFAHWVQFYNEARIGGYTSFNQTKFVFTTQMVSKVWPYVSFKFYFERLTFTLRGYRIKEIIEVDFLHYMAHIISHGRRVPYIFPMVPQFWIDGDYIFTQLLITVMDFSSRPPVNPNIMPISDTLLKAIASYTLEALAVAAHEHNTNKILSFVLMRPAYPNKFDTYQKYM